MKHESKIALACVVGMLLTLGIASVWADRIYVVTSASARAQHLTLTPLIDGGVRAEVCGVANKADGGIGAAGCYRWELTGAAQTAGLGMLNRGLQKWVSEEGL